jgi:copper(I)-binding protein
VSSGDHVLFMDFNGRLVKGESVEVDKENCNAVAGEK